jgi:hypothetical protein
LAVSEFIGARPELSNNSNNNKAWTRLKRNIDFSIVTNATIKILFLNFSCEMQASPFFQVIPLSYK